MDSGYTLKVEPMGFLMDSMEGVGGKWALAPGFFWPEQLER